MGRGSKRRKDAAHQTHLLEHSLRFWSLAVRKQLKVGLRQEDHESRNEWTLQACDAKMESIIIQNRDGRLRLVAMGDLVGPLEVTGLSLKDMESLFED
jgi:hypothetical protein